MDKQSEQFLLDLYPEFGYSVVIDLRKITAVYHHTPRFITVMGDGWRYDLILSADAVNGKQIMEYIVKWWRAGVDNG